MSKLRVSNLIEQTVNNKMGKYKYDIQEQQATEDFDVVFIRHAQSDFNKGTFSYIEQNQLYDVTWLSLLQIPAFNQCVTYHPQFIDAKITPKGKQQCHNAKSLFSTQQIDLILVSPQHRALQTCRQIFGDHPNVVVHPLVTQVFRYSCDLSHNVQKKAQQFPAYNFQEMKNWSHIWFLEVLTPDKQRVCQEHFAEKKASSLQQKQLIVLQLLKNGLISQTAEQLRIRIAKTKQLIAKTKEQYKATKVAVISHHYTTQCLLSPGFHENSEVKGIGIIQNGKPYFRKLEEILKVK